VPPSGTPSHVRPTSSPALAANVTLQPVPFAPAAAPSMVPSATPSQSPAPYQDIFLFPIMNPLCLDANETGVLLPTDPLLPCVNASLCQPPGPYSSSRADCSNWFCTLRLNCGCFAGQVSACNASTAIQLKPNCAFVVQMFEQSGCSWQVFLGPRSEPDAFESYLDSCLGGCSSLSPASPRSTYLLGALSVLAALCIL
jgi:hypothetical protein